MKRFVSVLLVAFLCVACVSITVAAQRDLSMEEVYAQELKELGLFRGVSETDFALGRAPSRVEALVMLIRVLGKENEVTEGVWKHPFTDVPKWADKYVGYAYSNALTNGQSQTEFGTGNANAAMYLTFVLRALGYSDNNGEDFVWSNPFTLARETGIITDKVDLDNFLRGDVVLVSHAALASYLNGTQQTLAQKLMSAGVFTQEQYSEVYNSKKVNTGASSVKDALSSEEIYEKCLPGMFYIELYDADKEPTSYASGFFIDDNGTAVTNYHVIDKGKSAKIQLFESETMYDVKGVYDYNKEQDWAIISVDIKDNEYLDIEKSEKVVGGSVVYALGTPMGMKYTISEGIVSNPETEIDGVKYIQTSAPVSPGSSGGPLINKNGQVVGIISMASIIIAQNLNYAVPIAYIENYKNDALISFEDFAMKIEAENKAEENEKEEEEEEEEPLAPVNKTAYLLLKGFIEKHHQNVDEKYGYEHTIAIYKESSIRLFTLYYDSKEDYITVKVTMILPDEYVFEFLFYVDPVYSLTESVFYAEQETANAGSVRISEGHSIIPCQMFNKDYDFQFDVYEGADWADKENVMKIMLDDGLNYLDYIFEMYLWDFGNCSVKDLGYLTYETFSESATSDEEFKIAFSNIYYNVDKESVTVFEGETAKISFSYDAINFPEDAQMQFVCEDEEVATAYWGDEENLPWTINIEGVSEGTTNLIIGNTFNYEYIEIPITVLPGSRGNYFLSKRNIEIKAGKTEIITFNFFDPDLPGDVIFEVDAADENIVDVAWDDDDDNLPWNIIVKGKEKGTTTITVFNDYNRDFVTATVTVK